MSLSEVGKFREAKCTQEAESGCGRNAPPNSNLPRIQIKKLEVGQFGICIEHSKLPQKRRNRKKEKAFGRRGTHISIVGQFGISVQSELSSIETNPLRSILVLVLAQVTKHIDSIMTTFYARLP